MSILRLLFRYEAQTCPETTFQGKIGYLVCVIGREWINSEESERSLADRRREEGKETANGRRVNRTI